MALRYVEINPADTQAFLPNTELLASGLLRSQQRQDLAKESWSKNVQEAASRKYANQADRDAYIQQQQELWNQTIDKNLGNLSKGYSDVLSAIETDKMNPYHNLNNYQLEQSIIEQKKKEQFGDKAAVYSDVLNQRLFNPETKQWTADLKPLTANVLESPDYGKLVDEDAKDIVNDVVNLTNQQKLNWKNRYTGDELTNMISQFSETMLRDYADKYGAESLINNAKLMGIDNSINAGYDPTTGLNQFQGVDGKIDKNKVVDFVVKRLADKVNVQTIPAKEKEKNTWNINLGGLGDSKRQSGNSPITSIFDKKTVNPESLTETKKYIDDTNTAINNVDLQIKKDIQSLRTLGLKVDNIEDLQQFKDENGNLDRNKLPLGRANAIESIIRNIGNYNEQKEALLIDKQGYENVYDDVTNKVFEKTKPFINTKFNKLKSQLGNPETSESFNAVGVTTEDSFDDFIKENINLTEEEFIKKYYNGKEPNANTDIARKFMENTNIPKGQIVPKEGYEKPKLVGLKLLYNTLQNDIKPKLNENTKDIGVDDESYYETNIEPESPEANYIESFAKTAGNTPLRYILTNLSTIKGDKLSDMKINPNVKGKTPNDEQNITTYKGTETLAEILSKYGNDDFKVDFYKPRATDMLGGSHVHIRILDKKGNIVFEKTNLKSNDNNAVAELVTQQVSNALNNGYDRPADKKYTNQAILNLGAVKNGENIRRSGAKYTPNGEQSIVYLNHQNGTVKLITQPYLDYEGIKYFRILDKNGTEIFSNIKQDDLYNSLYLLSGKYALLNDSNLSSVLSKNKKLSEEIEKLSSTKMLNFKDLY